MMTFPQKKGIMITPSSRPPICHPQAIKRGGFDEARANGPAHSAREWFFLFLSLCFYSIFTQGQQQLFFRARY